MDKKEQNVEVVVVGGGISGLAAAVALQVLLVVFDQVVLTFLFSNKEDGFQVVLLEARQRLGGRICTVQVTDALPQKRKSFFSCVV